MERRRTFDTVAAQYDAVRPGYPEALVERVLARSRLRPESRLLEIGCGTGIATLPYARRGHAILCLEPGPNLAAIARRKLAPFERVSVVEADFEDWEEEPGAFDLVYAASAWHHLDPSLRYRKAARSLREGGTLALYFNWAGNFEEGQEAYRRHVPDWADRPAPTLQERFARGVASLTRSGCFTAIETHSFPWAATYTAEEYVQYLGTTSDHLLLPAATREALFGAVQARIDRLGGTIERRYDAGLFLAAPVESIE